MACHSQSRALTSCGAAREEKELLDHGRVISSVGPRKECTEPGNKTLLKTRMKRFFVLSLVDFFKIFRIIGIRF
jgi:hypothetical protein